MLIRGKRRSRNHQSPLAEFKQCLESISGIIAHRQADGQTARSGWIPVDKHERHEKLGGFLLSESFTDAKLG